LIDNYDVYLKFVILIRASGPLLLIFLMADLGR